MSAQFWPCPGCSRHVKRGDAICRFCGATASVDIGSTRVLAGRLSRAALFAAGAVGVGLATDCGPSAVAAYGGMACPCSFEGVTDAGEAGTTSEPTDSSSASDAPSTTDGPADGEDTGATPGPTDSS